MLKKELTELLETVDISPEQATRISHLFDRIAAQGRYTIPMIDDLDLDRESLIDIGSLDSTVSSFQDDNEVRSMHTKPEIMDLHTDLGHYQDLGLLGKGGMAEVRKVQDHRFNRSLAMKIIHPHLMKSASAQSRFIEEAQVISQLQHPNITPVYELGVLPDGRHYFTMKEIKGQDLASVIRELHLAVNDNKWWPTSNGWNLHRIVDVFQKVCDAVAFAHSKGVLHRDLKPSNVMLGPFGEVLVVDWGIAKVLGTADSCMSEGVVTDRFLDELDHTRSGQVAGTPSYMSPEQAAGKHELISECSDVYALGAILYQILAGRPPFLGKTSDEVLVRVLVQEPASLRQFITDDGNIYSSRSGAPLPRILVEICEKALHKDIEKRFQKVQEINVLIQDWLDGVKKQEYALELVEKALVHGEIGKSLLGQSSEIYHKAELQLHHIPRWADAVHKKEAWALLDEAEDIKQQAEYHFLNKERLLQGALCQKIDLEEAHEALAEEYMEQHKRLEEEQDRIESRRVELMLREHVDSFLEVNPKREAFVRYLQGDGSFDLITEPSGARVILERYTDKERRLRPIFVEDLGVTPIIKQALPLGSYRLRLQKNGFQEVLYPIFIRRQDHWDGKASPMHGAMKIWLPRLGRLSSDDCYVPAGWFWCGGNPETMSCLAKRQLWLNAFVMKKYSVTNAQFVVFLNNLLETDRREQANSFSPRSPVGLQNDIQLIDGRYQVTKERQRYPVAAVDWYGANAYAEWYAVQTGLPWRLPSELEWEKAARGVDGRLYVWGDFFDPSWACMRFSHKDGMRPVSVDEFPADTSPYGVRGMMGNVRAWTASIYQGDGQHVPEEQELAAPDEAMSGDVGRVGKGGGWASSARSLRADSRRYNRQRDRFIDVGFRLCRSITIDEFNPASE